jgi:histone acetyltransferase (RNA polymerase elongator complex component)
LESALFPPVWADTAPTVRTFRHPEPLVRTTRIWPVYLAWRGCPGRCVFCAQPLQSGQSAISLDRILVELEAGLEAAGQAGRGPYELAFYGGVFTALPAPWPERFLEAARRARARGLVTRVRCSTRPDACAPAVLASLGAAGLDLVEIGAPCFRDEVLAAAGRGHDAASIRRAARDVRQAGLALGLQLLPGLPGHAPADLADDVAEAAALGPEIVRLHPCLVPRGTPLETLYLAGRYVPWALSETIEALAAALPVLWRAGVRVARIGLAPEPGFLQALLAGPWHPALGTRVRGRATLTLLSEAVRDLGGRAFGLRAPKRYSGELFGHAAELAPAYAALGLARAHLRFEAREDFQILPLPV